MDTREACSIDDPISWPDQFAQGSAEQHCIAFKALPPESLNMAPGGAVLNTTLRNPGSIYLFEKYDTYLFGCLC